MNAIRLVLEGRVLSHKQTSIGPLIIIIGETGSPDFNQGINYVGIDLLSYY